MINNNFQNEIKDLQNKYVNIKGSFTFYYGTMCSSKSANLLMNAKNYEIQNKDIIILKPSTDDRWIKTEVSSRAGVESKTAIVIPKEANLYNLLLDKLLNDNIIYYCIFIDEAQFLTKKQIEELSRFNVDIGIPISAYGLKNTYKKGELFEGSAALLFYADQIEEIQTICYYCNQKATQNLRIENNKPVYTGETEKLGDIKEENSSLYLPVCQTHYQKPILN